MSTLPAAIVAMIVLSAAGFLPAVALAGRRLVTIVLCPLAGCVLAALSAWCLVALGWSLIGWFVVLAGLAALLVAGIWILRPDWRPWSTNSPEPAVGAFPEWATVVRVVAVIGIVAACAWSLRVLSTPSIGFDARALWLLRSGWFLQSHHQVLLDLRTRDIILVQTPYPPLVSASAAVAWRVTGNESMRLGVVVIALINSCALVAASLAVLDAGRTVSARLLTARGEGPARRVEPAGSDRTTAVLPLVVAAILAVLLVFIAFGILEPFMTNGYADPIWSLAALAALAYGLQLPVTRSNAGVAAVFVLVAGMSKNEGTAAAAAIVVLVALRLLACQPRSERRANWWKPVAVAAVELAAIGAWPALMRLIHARGVTETYSPVNQWFHRARVSYDGMVPYLHVLVLAVPVAVVAGLVLSRVRRVGGLANDWWGWAGLLGGMLSIVGTLITGTVPIVPWVQGSVHRTTEFASMAAWWILAVWAIVASSALSVNGRSDDEASEHPQVSAAAPEPETSGPDRSPPVPVP
jgi:hypothetical protein